MTSFYGLSNGVDGLSQLPPKKLKATVALQLGLYNQRPGEGTPTENQGGVSSSGGCRVNGHLSTLHLPGELPGELIA